MKVTKLFIKPQHGVPLKECNSLTLRRGWGSDLE